MNATAPKLAGPPGSPSRAWGGLWTSLGVCIFLTAIVWSVFGRTIHSDFVNFDDDTYVYENPVVSRGLTQQGILWAFTRFHSFNWHPLTWISHMVDCEYYGLDAGGHHLTNVVLHATAAILLFLVLRNATGFLWRSAFVAAVFAIHPLRVESVAWVAERKDVLSGVFFMLTIGVYVRYSRRAWSPARYGLVVLLFGLGLLCKPMLVTLPVVLLLLDYWPLNRFQNSAAQPAFQFAGFAAPKRLIFEKLPLLGLSLASSIVTFFAQSQATSSFEQVSLSSRITNAVISCAVYLEQLFWPAKLAVLYPFPSHSQAPWKFILAAVLLVAISMSVFAFRKTRPYLLAGWLWYLVMLTPVIGIFQVGVQARADRYTYLPQIGVTFLLTWMVADACGRWRIGYRTLGCVSAATLAALALCARVQTGYWKNSESLWAHTLACTSDNFTAETDFGISLLEKSDVDEAIVQFHKALAIRPRYAEALAGLGSALRIKGDLDDAIADFQKALEVEPKNAVWDNNLGNALLQKGDLHDAIAQYETAEHIDPDSLETQNNLGYALMQEGKTNDAILHLQKALDLARAAGRSDVAQGLAAQLKSLGSGTPAQ